MSRTIIIARALLPRRPEACKPLHLVIARWRELIDFGRAFIFEAE
jgi:hypothetical protein